MESLLRYLPEWLKRLLLPEIFKTVSVELRRIGISSQAAFLVCLKRTFSEIKKEFATAARQIEAFLPSKSQRVPSQEENAEMQLAAMQL